MARTILEGKTCLVTGADHAIGRAAALQFSRSGLKVALLGDDTLSMGETVRLLASKGGDATWAELPESLRELTATLREERDRAGHFHVVVNASAFVGEKGLETARGLHEAAAGVLGERGFTRYLVLLPEGSPAPDWLGEANWVSVVYVPAGDSGPKPGAVADTLVFLAQCPPSACPAEVRVVAKKGD